MKSISLYLLLITAIAVRLGLATGVPLSWNVETSRVQPIQFDAYHGETIELTATLKSYGKPLVIKGQPSLYWQTNGMGQAFWTAPAEVISSNVLRALFKPSMDPGASVINGYIGIPGEIYRAAFQLRFRPSPGATPNALEMPQPVLDSKRDKIDLTVYETRKTPRLPADALPVTYGGKTYAANELTWFSVQDDDELLPELWVGCPAEAFVGFFNPDGTPRGMENVLFAGRAPDMGVWPKLESIDVTTPTKDQLATTSDVAKIDSMVTDTHGWARGVFEFLSGNTNAWFAATNYVVGLNKDSKHKFTFEPEMDLTAMPCSMALWELRDGKKDTVWDSRDWVSWYWSFKAKQLREDIAATNATIIASIPQKAWSKYTASGLDNPDAATTWIDTPSTTLAAGMAWQTVAHVSGCAYWTIVGHGAVMGGSATNSILEIKDFEGKSVMRIRKGESSLKYLMQEDILGQRYDSQGRVTFDLRSNVQPVGEYSTTLEGDTFVAEDDPSCPADYMWEDLGGEKWRIHFLLKPGIDATCCFAKFKISVEQESTIEYSTAPTISGGLIYNGVKIIPVISGDSVSWRVAR